MTTTAAAIKGWLRKLLQHHSQRVPTPTPLAPNEHISQRVPSPAHSINPLAARRSKSTKPTKIDTLRDPTPEERKTKSFKQLALRIGQRFQDTETDETFVVE